MEHNKEFLIKLLSIAIELNATSQKLDKVGITFELISERGYDLFDLASDVIDLSKPGIPFEYEGERRLTNRDYLHAYFYDAILENKTAIMVYDDLIQMKKEEELSKLDPKIKWL